MPCDYSLELYKSRPAETEENLTTYRFPSGTIGFIGKDATGSLDKETACCVLPGTTMVLSGINETTQRSFGLGPIEEAVFIRMDVGAPHAHRDALRFANGREILLQSINHSATAQITGMSPELQLPETARPVEAPPIAALIG